MSSPREWWINTFSNVVLKNEPGPILAADEEIIRVIEYSAYEAACDSSQEAFGLLSEAIKERDRLADLYDKEKSRAVRAEQELEATKKAKAENDERFQLERDEAVALKDKAVETAIAIGVKHNRMVKERDEVLVDLAASRRGWCHNCNATAARSAKLEQERDEARAELGEIARSGKEYIFGKYFAAERARSAKLIEALKYYQDLGMGEGGGGYGLTAKKALAEYESQNANCESEAIGSLSSPSEKSVEPTTEPK